MGLFDRIKNKKEEKEYDGFYHLDDILERNAVYNMIFGERSSGKTYACLEYALKKHCETGERFAYLRRWDEDFRGKRGTSLFDALVKNGLVEKYSHGEYNSIDYWSGRFYLCKVDKEKMTRVKSPDPFGYAFGLSTMEHDKSSSYPLITTVIFDEFITRTTYLPDEFVLFQNTLSTIIRDRDNVKVFMLGNTVNQFCPYFREMGLKHVKGMSPGDINLYISGKDKRLRIAVEFTGGERIRSEKPSDFYFAFDNPNLQMITNGEWELGMYPHLYPSHSYKSKDIRLTYYIEFEGEVIRCDVIKIDKNIITYCHRQTRDIKDEHKHLYYSLTQTMKPNYRVRIDRPSSELEQFIYSQFKYNNVYYEDNEVGDIIMNYIQTCVQMK